MRSRLVYANDNDPAPGATVSVDAVGADGVATTPSPLRDNGDGTYEGTLMLAAPGDYTLRFTATTPLAGADAPYATPSATTATTTPVTSTRPPEVDESDDSGGDALPIVVAVAGVVVIAAGAAGFLLWRRRTSP